MDRRNRNKSRSGQGDRDDRRSHVSSRDRQYAEQCHQCEGVRGWHTRDSCDQNGRRRNRDEGPNGEHERYSRVSATSTDTPFVRDEGPNGEHERDSRGAAISTDTPFMRDEGPNGEHERDSRGSAISTDTPFMILLVGYPGSGKSHFSTQLEQAVPSKYVRVNQDTLGNRKRCEKVTRNVLSQQKCPIIDRCNFDESQRAYFLEIARHFNIPVDCILFEVPKEECVRRCENRANHETVHPSEARLVVERMARQFSAPVESTFRTLKKVSDFNAVEDLMLEYSNAT